MLGPLLNSLWQQVSPAAQQLFKAIAPYASRIPPYVYARAAEVASNRVSDWYSDWHSSLSPEAQKKLDDTIAWAKKDLAGDIANMVTGLPVKPLVEKVLDVLSEYKHRPEAEAYITDQLTRQPERRSPTFGLTGTQEEVLTVLVKNEGSLCRSELESLMPATSSSSVGAALIALTKQKIVSEDVENARYLTSVRLEYLE